MTLKNIALDSADIIQPSENAKEEQRENEGLSREIKYKIDDVPPWYVSLILSFQHYLTMLGGTVSYPYLVSSYLCIPKDNPSRGYIVSTTFFVSGICTFLQATFGVRLPIVQGSSMAFLVPVLAILKLPEWTCPDIDVANNTLSTDDIWMPRMREVQGAIIGAAAAEVFIGFTGIIGFLLHWITPLSIIPTITLVGFSLFEEAARSSSGNWGISLFTIFLMVLFSQCLRNVSVPYPKFASKCGWKTGHVSLFQLFPVLLTILISWALCSILTVTEVFGIDNPARTDMTREVLSSSPWFRIPYPGQWGWPTFTAPAILGALAGSVASTIESVGDYFACARLSGAPPPPKHAVNRGIFVEGVGCVIAGLFGTASGVTSFSENIGAIGITKVASRRVIQYGSLLMILLGMLSKFGAIFATIPEPILGGIFCIMFSMITSVGLSTLHFVDLNSSRNLFVLGFSLFMGLSIPKWVQGHSDELQKQIGTGGETVVILLSTSMLVGGFLGCLLDNIIPGSHEERGIDGWKKHEKPESSTSYEPTLTYQVPFASHLCSGSSLLRYLPITSSYQEGIFRNKLDKLKSCLRNRRESSQISKV